MKKLLLLFVAVATFNNSKATISLLDKETKLPVVNGTTIQVWGGVDESLITWHNISAVNNTGSTTKINMKRYALNSQATVEDYFCWYVCLGSVVSNTTPVLNHSTGACFNSNNLDTLNYFSAYYKPMGLTGSATYRFVWFNASNTNDSAYIDITFNVTPLSVNETSKEIGLSIYPNPAKEIINMNIENVNFSTNVSVEIYDMIGTKVLSQNVSGSIQRFDASDLANGSYLVTLISDKKSILTKKIIISH